MGKRGLQLRKVGSLFTVAVMMMWASQPVVASAAPFEMSMFGHRIAIVKHDFEQVLTIDGREVHKNEFLNIDDVRIILGVPTLVGSSSPGGNSCASAPFVVSFPENANPKIDGPIDSCNSVTTVVSADRLTFSTKRFPNEPGQTWTWTPTSGFSGPTGQPFVPLTSKGWAQLRERSITHPGDILEYAEIASQIDVLLGADKERYESIITGTGSGAFDGDTFVGYACTRHLCTEEEALVVASIQQKKVFLAWKPSGQKITVRPVVGEWPETAKRALREWAAKWK